MTIPFPKSRGASNNRGFKSAKFFFDRDVVIKAMDKKTYYAMKRSALSIRMIARRSMRYRKRTSYSAPGSPPHSHKDGRRGPMLRRDLIAAYDPSTKSQVIGPEPRGKNIVPELMEHGGETMVTRFIPRPKGKPLSAAAKAAFLRKAAAGQIQKNKLDRRTVRARYPARPFMLPALKLEQVRYPKRWGGVLAKV